ncbi:hypothetical protein [Natronorubrum sp. DTA28]|uniref:hypothetical protein n=1 Tax=Natronorubrum sp. DTA28 TaxID=3447019 RepID=UPI003F838650
MKRRSILAATGGLALTGIGSVKASRSNNQSNDLNDNANDQSEYEGSISIDEDEPGEKEDWEEMVTNRLEGRPEYSDTDDVTSQTVAGSDPDLENLEYEDHWKSETEPTRSCTPGSDFEGETEHVLTAFKVVDPDTSEHVTDSNGDYRYVIELWSQLEEESNTSWNCPTVYWSELDWELNSNSNNTTFHGRDPSSKETIDDERITVSYSYSAGGVSYGSEDVVRVDDGVFGADSWTPGPGGKYEVSWEGEEDLVDIIAFADIATSCKINFDGGCGTGLEWGWSLSTGP